LFVTSTWSDDTSNEQEVEAANTVLPFLKITFVPLIAILLCFYFY
jgi:hypothetical protein